MKSIHKIQSYPLLLVLLTLASGFQPVKAQVDEQRMERDIVIMQRALNEMLRQDLKQEIGGFWGSSKEKARYIPDVGIMLHAQTKGGLAPLDDSDKVMHEDEAVEEVFKNFLADYGDLARELPGDESIVLRYASGKQKGPSELTSTPLARGYNRVRLSSEKSQGTLTAKVSQKDVMRYRRGDMTREAFEEAIEITRTTGTGESAREFKVFSQMLKGLFEEGDEPFASTISIRGGDEEDWNHDSFDNDAFKWNSYSFKTAWGNRVDFERLEGVGVVYEFSLGYYLEGYNSLIALGLSGKKNKWREKGNAEEEAEEEASVDEEKREYLLNRDEKLEDIYGNFLNDMKEAMVLYGRTLRSLKKDEYLIIRTEMPACYECQLPEEVEFKISRAELALYDEGKSDYDEVIDNVEISENGEAKRLKDLEGMLYYDDGDVQIYNQADGQSIHILRDRKSRKKDN